jgi:ribosome-binding ATPase YchF (GTP1/OBG family)
MQVGIVGKPSSGKSTFFNAATMADVPMAAYPFTTIEANRGCGFVRIKCADRELGVQCNPRTGFCTDGTRFVPAEIIDVAGLVPGAHEGKGRGNQFLSDLSRADVLIHVVDASGSTNEEGEHVGAGNHDPCLDVRFLEEEIEEWFLGILNKNWKTFSRKPVSSKAQLIEVLAQNLSGVGATPASIEKSLAAADLTEKKLETWTDEDRKSFAVLLRKESKPIAIAANKCDIEGAAENVERMKKEFPHLAVIACSAISELALKKAAKEGKIKYVQGNGSFEVSGETDEKQKAGLDYIKQRVLGRFGSTGVQEVLDSAVFDVLKYIAVYPGGTKKLSDQHGNVMPDCFLMPPDSAVIDFAYRLHTDFGEHFIRAVDVKTKKMVGREHPLKNRDVIEIIHDAR